MSGFQLAKFGETNMPFLKESSEITITSTLRFAESYHLHLTTPFVMKSGSLSMITANSLTTHIFISRSKKKSELFHRYCK